MRNHEQKTEHKVSANYEEVWTFAHGRAQILTVGGAGVVRVQLADSDVEGDL